MTNTRGPACEGLVDTLKGLFKKPDVAPQKLEDIRKSNRKSIDLVEKDLDRELKDTYESSDWVKKHLPPSAGTVKIADLETANVNGKQISNPAEIVKVAQQQLRTIKDIAARERPFMEKRRGLIDQASRINEASQLDQFWVDHKEELSISAVDRMRKLYRQSQPALSCGPKETWPFDFHDSKATDFTGDFKFKTSGEVKAPSQQNASEYLKALRDLMAIAEEAYLISTANAISYWDGVNENIDYKDLAYSKDIYRCLNRAQDQSTVSDLTNSFYHTVGVIIVGLYVAMFSKRSQPAMEELNDSTGTAASLPLPPDHWVYERSREDADMLDATDEELLRETIRRSTMSGQESSFDPDAVWQNFKYLADLRKQPEAKQDQDEEFDELELERLRLAGCGVIANSNTRESLDKQRSMHPKVMCGSIADVIQAIEREIALREQRDWLVNRTLECDDEENTILNAIKEQAINGRAKTIPELLNAIKHERDAAQISTINPSMEGFAESVQVILPRVARGFKDFVGRFSPSELAPDLHKPNDRFVEAVRKARYVDLAPIAITVPEGMHDHLLTYSNALLSAVEYTADLVDRVAGFNTYLAILVSHPDARFETKSNIVDYRKMEIKRKILSDAISICFKPGSLNTVRTYGDVIERNRDWDTLWPNLAKITKTLQIVDRKKLNTAVAECSRLLAKVEEMSRKGQLDDASPAVLQEVAEATFQLASELEFYSVVYFRIMAFETTLKETQKTIADIVLSAG